MEARLVRELRARVHLEHRWYGLVAHLRNILIEFYSWYVQSVSTVYKRATSGET